MEWKLKWTYHMYNLALEFKDIGVETNTNTFK